MNKQTNVLTSLRIAHEVIKRATNDSEIINLHWGLMWLNFVVGALILK